jgi:hypothetical protein
VKQFTDFDGKLHPVGESWTYLGKNFVPYHDGLSALRLTRRRTRMADPAAVAAGRAGADHR